MISFVQAHRAEPYENELMERALLDKKPLNFLMKLGDAEAVLETFRPNYDSGDYSLSIFQRAKIWAFGHWNTSYGNVVGFVLHMSIDKVRLSIKQREDPEDSRVGLLVRLVEHEDAA